MPKSLQKLASHFLFAASHIFLVMFSSFLKYFLKCFGHSLLGIFFQWHLILIFIFIAWGCWVDHFWFVDGGWWWWRAFQLRVFSASLWSMIILIFVRGSSFSVSKAFKSFLIACVGARLDLFCPCLMDPSSSVMYSWFWKSFGPRQELKKC